MRFGSVTPCESLGRDVMMHIRAQVCVDEPTQSHTHALQKSMNRRILRVQEEEQKWPLTVVEFGLMSACYEHHGSVHFADGCSANGYAVLSQQTAEHL